MRPPTPHLPACLTSTTIDAPGSLELRLMHWNCGCALVPVPVPVRDCSRACSVYARYAGQANGGSLLLPPSLAKSTIPLQHFSSDPLQLDIQSAANEGDADRSVSQLAFC